MDHPAADQIADLVIDELLAGQHVNNTRHGLGGVDIDAFDFRVGVRAADERRVGHAMEADVVGVFALARDETLVFLARDPCADTFNTHNPDLSIRAALIARAARGSCTSDYWVVAADHSAAAATFMRPAASSTDLTMLW